MFVILFSTVPNLPEEFVGEGKDRVTKTEEWRSITLKLGSLNLIQNQLSVLWHLCKV